MGLFTRRHKAQANSPAQAEPQGASPRQLAWLPGNTEVQVAGETFHLEAIRAADSKNSPGSPCVAVFVPDPGNVHHPRAVAIYVNGEHVGFLPHEIAERVQPAFLAFSDANHGRVVSCPAEIRWHDIGPQVVLLLDPAPLRLSPAVFDTAPEMAAVTMRLITRLDEPSPHLAGAHVQARAKLERLDRQRQEIDDDWDTGRGGLHQVERGLRAVTASLAETADPATSEAWLSVARATRYQHGRRDDTLSALIEALYWGRDNDSAWSELLDYVSAAPHMPMLLALFGRIPVKSRQAVLSQFIAISEGRDRCGRMHPVTGARLRNGLLSIAESQDDKTTAAALLGYAGLKAEKAADVETAVANWRGAIAAGSTDEKVADRFSVWLANHHEYQEAVRVLRQALAVNPQSATVADRLRRRLARCERMLRPMPQAPPHGTPKSASARSETLVCHECGQAFVRTPTRGRKPLRCEACASDRRASRE